MFLRGIDDADAADLGGAQRMSSENHWIIREFDDVDFLSAQLADDRLHAHAFHAHAGAHRINVFVPRHHRDLSALARLARDRSDDHRAVIDLRHFRLEQIRH